MKIFCNSFVLLQIEDWDSALQSINPVLRVQPTNVKALFRKGKVGHYLVNVAGHVGSCLILSAYVIIKPVSPLVDGEVVLCQFVFKMFNENLCIVLSFGIINRLSWLCSQAAGIVYHISTE